MKADRTCYFVAGLVIVGIIGALCGVFIVNRSSGENTKLSQVHVIFSHGERTPTVDEVEIFPRNDNHSDKYYPHGYNALTNKGKMTMFKTGTALRKLYDDFLTKDYVQTVFSMQTTDDDITKISALLVLAGLWPVPSEEMWIDLAWQPVPFFNLEKSEDYMLYPENCNKYKKEREKVNRDFLEKNNFLYEDLYQSLSNYTGTTITEPFQVKQLWNLLLAEKNIDISSPKWFRTIENEIMDVVKLEYKNMFYNTNMRRLSAGSILEKVLDDSKEKIKHDDEGVEGMKMLMYSGYSHNIAAVLAATENLDLFEENFGLSLVIELHLRLMTTDYALKIFLYRADGETIDIEIGNCGKLCPVEEFEQIMSSFLLKDYKGECKQDLSI